MMKVIARKFTKDEILQLWNEKYAAYFTFLADKYLWKLQEKFEYWFTEQDAFVQFYLLYYKCASKFDGKRKDGSDIDDIEELKNALIRAIARSIISCNPLLNTC